MPCGSGVGQIMRTTRDWFLCPTGMIAAEHSRLAVRRQVRANGFDVDGRIAFPGGLWTGERIRIDFSSRITPASPLSDLFAAGGRLQAFSEREGDCAKPCCTQPDAPDRDLRIRRSRARAAIRDRLANDFPASVKDRGSDSDQFRCGLGDGRDLSVRQSRSAGKRGGAQHAIAQPETANSDLRRGRRPG